jgi:pilus assembly protein CpaC
MKTIARSKSQYTKLSVTCVAIIMSVGLLSGQSVLAGQHAAMVSAQASHKAQGLDLVLGKSTVVAVPASIKRASLADPAIADAIVLSPKQLYVTGKAYGSTNLILWGRDDQVLAIFDLEVGVDVTRLQDQLKHFLPDETNLHPVGSNDHLTLSGSVSSSAKLSQALALAEAFAPKRVINLLKIYPDEPGTAGPGELNHVTVEVIRGTAVNAVKF